MERKRSNHAVSDFSSDNLTFDVACSIYLTVTPLLAILAVIILIILPFTFLEIPWS